MHCKKSRLKTRGLSIDKKRKTTFKAKAMKSKNNLYEKVYSIDNLMLADYNAQKGKSKQHGVIRHNKNRDSNLLELQRILIEKTYRTSEYQTFKVFEPKERVVYKLPYFPDRITHHAIMNILEPIFMSVFRSESYSCIKGKGIHSASEAVKKALKDKENTKYCLKLDIKKFYPSVDHEILKKLLRKKIWDKDLLWLLDSIIDSADGLPIGNYLSQYFANFYLTYFDHWIKKEMKIRHYFRYADDLVFFTSNKEELHQLLRKIKEYLETNLKLHIKENYQIFPVEERGVDFVGYVHYHTHTRLRKSIKKNFARMIAKNRNKASIASYKGWAVHCDSKHLLKKLLK